MESNKRATVKNWAKKGERRKRREKRRSQAGDFAQPDGFARKTWHAKGGGILCMKVVFRRYFGWAASLGRGRLRQKKNEGIEQLPLPGEIGLGRQKVITYRYYSTASHMQSYFRL